MDYTRIFTLSSALIVAASVFGGSAEARKLSLDQCMGDSPYKAECACETALQKGTQKALRDFLKLYRNADTACNAQASTEIIIENGGNGGEIGSSSSNGGSSTGGIGGNNPGNNKSVGHAGENPSGHGYGNGQHGKSQ